jgi:hypothetical protein
LSRKNSFTLSVFEITSVSNQHHVCNGKRCPKQRSRFEEIAAENYRKHTNYEGTNEVSIEPQSSGPYPWISSTSQARARIAEIDHATK